MTSEVGRHEQSEELSLLRVQGAELCFTILGPSLTRTPPNREDADHHLRHTGVVEELISLWTAVSSVVDRV
jgi:hypothetical protein